ncbi:MAG: PAS domain S-box protein [Rhodospirillaceae bacterium]
MNRTDDRDMTEAPLRIATHGLVVLGDTVQACNERFCRMMGQAREALVGRPLLEVCPQVQADGAFSRERWQRRTQAAKSGLPQWFPWQFRNAGGRRVHALVHLSATANDTLVAHVHDLSNLQQAGWIKPESLSRLQDVLDHTKAVIFVKDLEGRYVFANRELERVVRVPAEQIVGHTDHELWPPEVAQHFRANDAQVLRERSAIEFEVGAEVAHQQRTFLSFKFPLFGADGEPYAICGIATDITDRKRTQDALTSAALAVSSAQGATVFQELVRYLATILGMEAAFIAAPWPEGGDQCHMRMHAFFLDGEVRENFDYPLAGTPCETVMGQSFRIYPSAVSELFPADVDFKRMGFESYAGFPLRGGNGDPLGIISVVSRAKMMNAEFVESILKIFAVRAAAELERQRAEETLRASEASYRAIFEASEDAIFVHDWDSGALIDVNQRACEVYGYSHEEFRRLSIAEVSSGEHPYTAAEAAKRLQEAKAGHTVRMEWHRRNKDGSLHWDEVVLRPAVIAGRRRLLAFTREITERKHAEQALRQAQKMEALGHLTGGIAHDFNNLLTSIMGYVVLASEQPSAQTEVRLRKYLEQAQFSCERARDLIQQMLMFSRGQRGQPRPVALSALVAESVNLFSSSLPAAIGMELKLEREVCAVMLDPVQLDQILLNLCLNARDAIAGTGTIRVSVAPAPPGEHVCTACRKRGSGEYVQLCVEDDGPGIAPEIVDRIFEPFFTTKEVGKGSGMGLASVHGIVHELGGHVVVETAVGKGTRFCVLFPALPDGQEEDDVRPAATRRAPLRRLAGRVLVVDDERAVATFMGDLLESWGLEVMQAANAVDALALLSSGTARCDLVITDQMMPRMTGMELARKLMAIRPELPVILYTGRNDGLARADLKKTGLRAIVTKPVDPHELFGLLQIHLPVAAAEDRTRAG